VRVLLVSNFYPPYWVGGYEQIAAWVADGLRERGHQVAVLTGRGPAFEGRNDVIPELDLDLASLRDAYFGPGLPQRPGLSEAVGCHVFSRRHYAAARRAIARLRADVVSFWNPAFVSFAPLLAARAAAVPAVLQLSDTAANPFRNPHPPRFPRPLAGAARWVVDRLLRSSRPARVLVPSDFLRRKFAATESLPPGRTFVLRWPIEPTLSRRSPPDRDARPPSRVLYVGSLIPEKGPHVLLEAFRLALGRRPELSLTFVGDGPGPFVEGLRRAAAGLPARFLGRCERSAVTRAYEGHDILAFPSTWDEPFAVVPLEAMAMGLAVIATNAGGTPEAIEDGRTGLLVPAADPRALADALVGLAAEPARARALAAAAARRVRETDSFPAFMERLEAHYAEVLRH
jgi:glycosyltransferase involved in cell wall biosynthesis